MHLIDISFETICAAVKRHRLTLKNPPRTVDEYLETLAKQSLNQTVELLNSWREYI